MNIWLILFLFFAFQGITLSVTFLLKKKGNKYANILLSVYLALFSYEIFYNFLYWSGELFTINFIDLVHTNYIPWLLYGPLFYLYTSKVIRGKRIRYYDFIHIVPLLLMLFNYSPFYLASTARKYEIITNQLWSSKMYYYTKHEPSILTALLVFYLLLVVVTLRKRIVSVNKSNWFKLFVLCYLGYVVSFASYFILKHFEFFNIEYDYMIGFSMIAFVGGTAYFSFIQPDVFNGTRIQKLVPFVKYQRTGLTKEQSVELKFQVLKLMQTEELYLDCDLRLEVLAKKLDLARHHTSQIINEHFDLSFFDFINKYRVEYAKKLLMEDLDLSITEVLYSSGFNNRDSFYKAFKKFVGLTPTKFRASRDLAS